jgi:hypothetical protein
MSTHLRLNISQNSSHAVVWSRQKMRLCKRKQQQTWLKLRTALPSRNAIHHNIIACLSVAENLLFNLCTLWITLWLTASPNNLLSNV